MPRRGQSAPSLHGFIQISQFAYSNKKSVSRSQQWRTVMTAWCVWMVDGVVSLRFSFFRHDTTGGGGGGLRPGGRSAKAPGIQPPATRPRSRTGHLPAPRPADPPTTVPPPIYSLPTHTHRPRFEDLFDPLSRIDVVNFME